MFDLILKERETKEKLVEVINNANLPAFILRYMLKELVSQTDILIEQQYNDAKKQKEQMIKELQEIKKEEINNGV